MLHVALLDRLWWCARACGASTNGTFPIAEGYRSVRTRGEAPCRSIAPTYWGTGQARFLAPWEARVLSLLALTLCAAEWPVMRNREIWTKNWSGNDEMKKGGSFINLIKGGHK